MRFGVRNGSRLVEHTPVLALVAGATRLAGLDQWGQAVTLGRIQGSRHGEDQMFVGFAQSCPLHLLSQRLLRVLLVKATGCKRGHLPVHHHLIALHEPWLLAPLQSRRLSGSLALDGSL